MFKRLTLMSTLLTGALFACGGNGATGAPDTQDNGSNGASPTTNAAPSTGTPEAGGPAVTAPVVVAPTEVPTVTAPETTPATPATAPTAPATTAVTLAPIGAQPVANTPVAAIETHEPIQLPSAVAPVVHPPQPTYSKTWVVSGTGQDTAAGTAAAPFRTLGKAVSVVQPGELVLVKAGTYNESVVLTKAGTPQAKITFQGEGNPKITPGASGALVQFKAPYVIFDGFDIDVQNQARFAVTFTGNVQGSVIANSEIHHGTLGAGITTYDGAMGATIENNHVHHFSRGETDSHGISVQTTSRDIKILNNDIHDNSGDSVQCLGPETFNNNAPADGLLIEGNHFYTNRENGIDIKTCYNVTIRNNRIHGFRLSSSAKGDAVVVHYSAKNVVIDNNDIYDSGKGISVGGNHEGPVPTGVVIQRNRIHDIVTTGGMEGTGMRLENSDGTKVLNNTIVRTAGFALRLGGGTGGATSNATVKNNIIDATQNVNLGAQRAGLQMDGNLYGLSGSFGINGAAADWTAFKALGVDATSLRADPGLSATFTPGPVAIDKGVAVGGTYCGAAPDLGAVETGC